MSARRAFAALRWRIIRHGPHDERGFGLVAGLVAAAMVLCVAVLVQGDRLDPSWLTLTLSSWGLTWLLGPVLLPGAAPVMDPHWFRTLPRKPWQVARAMAPSEVLGVGTVITAVALGSLLVVAAPHGPAVLGLAALAGAAQLFFLIWLGRCAAAVVGRLLLSPVGVWVAAFQMSALLAVSFAGWVPVAAYLLPDLGEGRTEVRPLPLQGTVPELVEQALLALPTGWGLAAVDAAVSQAPAATVLLPVLGLLVGGTVLCAAWVMLTARTLAQPPARVQSSVRVRGARGARPQRTAGPTWGVVTRELKTWTRDPQRALELRHAWITPLLAVALVAPTHWSWALPFVGVLAAAFAAMVAVNTYALDGTAIWQLITTPRARQADVRGRQVAWLLLLGLPTLIGTVLLCVVSRSDLWPMALGATFAATGAACATAPLFAALMPAIGIDARDRVSTGQNAGNAAGGQMTAFVAVIAASVLPAVVANALGLGAAWGAHLVLGLAVGVLLVLAIMPLTQRRLDRSGTELLWTMASR